MIKKLKKKLQAGSFLRSVLTVASGTVIAQIIAVLVSPIITRMYTPEDMGVLASFTAIVAILGTLAAGRYELAVVLPKTDKDSNAVVIAGLIFAFLYSLIITIFIVLFYKPVVSFLNLKGDASKWAYLLGLFVFLTGVELLLNRVATKNAHFKVIASTQVTQQISNNGIKIIWGAFRSGSLGLFIATLFSTLSRIVRLSIGEFRIIFKKENRPTIKNIKKMAFRYKNFPLISSWAGLAGTATIQLPVVLFTALFSSSIAGYYSLSHRIITLPMSLIGASVANVFLEKAALNKDNDQELGRVTLGIYSKLLFISSICMSIIAFYGDLLFPLVFGSLWLEAGRYAQLLSVWIVFQFAISPLSSVYIVKELQTENLIWNIIQLGAVVVSLYIASFFTSNPYIIVGVFAFANSLLYFFYAYRIMLILKIKSSKFIKIILKSCISVYSIQAFIAFLIRSILKV